MQGKGYLIFSLFLCFMTFSTIVLGQEQYKKGYVVTNDNDTLWGFVKDRKPSPFGEIYEKIRFSDNERGKRKKRFAPNQIMAYMVDNKVYHSIWFNVSKDFFKDIVVSAPGSGKRVFLRVEETGYLTHYVDEFQEQGEELVQEINYFKKENNPKLIRATQGLLGLKRKRLIEFFSDCPPLVDKIRKKEFKYAFEVARFYNDWKENNP